MRKTIVKNETSQEFFRRGRRTARLLDAGRKVRARAIVSFEDPADMLRFLTPTRLALFRVIKAHPGSVASIAANAGRNRAAVTRDVAALSRYGLVDVTEKPFPGHGKIKEVRVGARAIKLEATLE
jgi:predicted transcriptional regulator